MVRAYTFVSIGNGGFFTYEEGTIIPELWQIIVRIFHVEFQVLRRIIIADGNGFVPVIGDVYTAIIPPGQLRHVS